MPWTVVFVLVGFWLLALVNGCSFGGLIHILLVYAGLIVIARLIERRRLSRGNEHIQPVAGSRLNPKES
jgi:flagellar biogenesis protein FliO